MAATLAHAPSANPIPAQSPSTVAQHYAAFVAAITATVPQRIALVADPEDVEERADHLNRIMTATMDYVAAIVRDTADVSSINIDWKYIVGCLNDYRGEAIGELQNAADQLWQDDDRRAARC